MDAPALTLSKVESAQRKVDDRWVLFFHEYVLSEPFEIENDVWWELLALVTFQNARGSL